MVTTSASVVCLGGCHTQLWWFKSGEYNRWVSWRCCARNGNFIGGPLISMFIIGLSLGSGLFSAISHLNRDESALPAGERS